MRRDYVDTGPSYKIKFPEYVTSEFALILKFNRIYGWEKSIDNFAT